MQSGPLFFSPADIKLLPIWIYFSSKPEKWETAVTAAETILTCSEHNSSSLPIVLPIPQDRVMIIRKNFCDLLSWVKGYYPGTTV